MTDTLVATIQKRGRFWAAEPHFPAIAAQRDGQPRARSRSGSARIVLASNRVSAPGGGVARSGELVLVALPTRGRAERARIVRVIGSPDVARDAIEGLLLHRGLARRFSPALEREAAAAGERGPHELDRELEAGARRDLRDLATFTIDPASARDFDDAISAERREGAIRVWVHIADVSAFVPEGSLVDREARARATSVYVPGAVEPMLPGALSNDACSLLPGLARAAVTVEMDLQGARLLRSAFYRSLIRSDERLEYEQVERIFASSESAREPWAAALTAAREASAALAGAREQRGGLTLDSGEPEFSFDDDGNVSAIATRGQSESHRLIEHLMIAANEAVAKRLAGRGTPCLYRVHERPEPARVTRLVEQLASLGVPTPAVPESLSPSQAATLLGEISLRVERHVRETLARSHGAPRSGARSRRRSPSDSLVDTGESQARPRSGPWGGRIALTSLVLRSLQQAFYSPRNIGHAGLRSDCYCHFTSPIRRYPDLVCHRALLSTLGPDESAPRASELRDLGEWSSERERAAMAIERAGEDLARCFALEQELYEQGWERSFSGEISGLISAGAFVSFSGERRASAATGSGALRAGQGEAGGPLYEGMLPVRRLRLLAGGQTHGAGEWWELDEHETMLRAEGSGSTIRLGDAIEVRVARVDTVRGRVDLVPGA